MPIASRIDLCSLAVGSVTAQFQAAPALLAIQEKKPDIFGHQATMAAPNRVSPAAIPAITSAVPAATPPPRAAATSMIPPATAATAPSATARADIPIAATTMNFVSM